MQNAPPESFALRTGCWFTGRQQDRMIDHCSSRGCGWEEAAQVLWNDTVLLLLQVCPLRMRQAHCHGQALEMPTQSLLRSHMYTEINKDLRISRKIKYKVSIGFGGVLTCRYIGRLSLRADSIWVCAAVSCWRSAWGSKSTSTMRKSSCWALEVANRWLQCLTKQPEKCNHNKFIVKFICCSPPQIWDVRNTHES